MRLAVPPGLVSALGAPLVGALAATWRFSGPSPRPGAGALPAGGPVVLICWHEVLLPLLWRHRGLGIALVVSQARDGQHLVDFAGRLGYGVARGSSTRGGARALLGAVRALQDGRVVAFTPDGPRGPRRRVKAGAVAAAQRAEVALLPLHAEVNRAWRLDSWDRFVLPKPWAAVRVAYGAPIQVEPGPDGLDRGIVAAQRELDLLAGDD